MKLYRLVSAEARRNAASACMDSPEGWEVRIKPANRNLEQNALLHALLTEIAETREWAGKKWDCESWKRLLTGAWSRANGQQAIFAPALDGSGIEVIYRRTSDLTKPECASLIDYIQAWQAGGDV